MTRTAWWIRGLIAAMPSIACGSGGGASSGDVTGTASTLPSDGGEIVVYASSFQGYRAWPSRWIEDDAGRGDPAHPNAPLVEYRSGPVVALDAAFPPGEILVKEPAAGDPGSRQAFAMVKRGAGYNLDGAVGWEWFELQSANDAGAVSILWRGNAPPSAEAYAGAVNGDCNGCHANAPHDGVFGQ